MKKFRPLLLLLITVGILSSPSIAFCQAQCNLLQANNAANVTRASDMAWGLSGLGFWSIYKASKDA
jgi:hypothetical protein